MDLKYIQVYLENLISYSPEYVTSKVKDLIVEINTYLQNSLEDTNDETYRHRALQTLQKYEDDLKIRSMDFDATPIDKIKDRGFKAQAVLATLSILQVFVQDILTKYGSGVNSNDNFYKYIRALSEKKVMYTNLSVTWSSILKSISQETSRQTELLKYKNS